MVNDVITCVPGCVPRKVKTLRARKHRITGAYLDNKCVSFSSRHLKVKWIKLRKFISWYRNVIGAWHASLLVGVEMQ